MKEFGCDLYSNLMNGSSSIELFIQLFEDNPSNFVLLIVHKYPVEFENGLRMYDIIGEIVSMKSSNNDQFTSYFEEYRREKEEEKEREEERVRLVRVQEEKMKEVEEKEREEGEKKRQMELEEEKEKERERKSRMDEIREQLIKYNSDLIELQV